MIALLAMREQGCGLDIALVNILDEATATQVGLLNLANATHRYNMQLGVHNETAHYSTPAPISHSWTMQIGFLNRIPTDLPRTHRSYQYGIINYATGHHGIQAGLINIRRNGDGKLRIRLLF
jgi:hypothetical protein